MDVGVIERNPSAVPVETGDFAPGLARPDVDDDLRVAAERLEEIRQHHLDLWTSVLGCTRTNHQPEQPA